MTNLNGVEDTLFIPLVGRIYSSKKFKEFFYDEKALELEKYIPTEMIKDNTGEYFTIASIARFYEFDNIVRNFIDKHGDCNVLCLGCGLETMYFRIKDDRARFFEIDFPDVIKQRKIVLGENDKEILIGSDILDYGWMDNIDKQKPTIVIVSGVFQYLHKEDILKLLHELQKQFKNIEVAFDATNKIGIKGAENYVKKTGNENAMMYFYIKNPNAFAQEANAQLIEVRPFYKNCTKILKKKLKFSTKFNCFFGDRLGFTKILYLKLN